MDTQNGAREERMAGQGRGARGRCRCPAVARDGLPAGALARVVWLHELRDLVHDHLGPGRDVHHVLVRVAERRPDRGVDRLAVLCAFGLMVACSMAELTWRYPPPGAPWWAHDLGGKGWSWMTGSFNIVGLVGIVASVAYGASSS